MPKKWLDKTQVRVYEKVIVITWHTVCIYTLYTVVYLTLYILSTFFSYLFTQYCKLLLLLVTVNATNSSQDQVGELLKVSRLQRLHAFNWVTHLMTNFELLAWTTRGLYKVPLPLVPLLPFNSCFLWHYFWSSPTINIYSYHTLVHSKEW